MIVIKEASKSNGACSEQEARVGRFFFDESLHFFEMLVIFVAEQLKYNGLVSGHHTAHLTQTLESEQTVSQCTR